MRHFIRRTTIVRPGKYFSAKNKQTAFAMVQKEMQEFLEKADVNDLVVDITDDIEDFKAEGYNGT